MNLIYTNEIIKKYLPEIINAYVDYFGIEHRKIIEEKFKNMLFLSYSSPEILKHYYKENREKENLDYIKSYLDACEESNKDIQLEENMKIIDNEDIVGKEMLKEVIAINKDATKMNGSVLCFFLNNNNNLIFIPTIYLVNPCLNYNYRDRMLIHEINHCVEITYKYDNEKVITTSGLEERSFDIYEKNNRIQLKYSDNNTYTPFEERQLTEFLNDRISYEIYTRLKKNGVNILDNNKDIEATKKWIRYIDKLDAFFIDYEEAIKLSRLYGNLDILLNEVGVLNKYELMKFLYTNYNVEAIFNGEQIKDFNNKQK